MSNYKIILAATVFGILVSGCGKADGNGNTVTETATDPQMELTEDQVMAMEIDGATKRHAGEEKHTDNGLTDKQRESTIAALEASGLTREQAEAMLAMGDGTPGSAEKVAAIAAMDPRAQVKRPKPKESRLTVRFDGVDYPMEFTKPQNCGDFFDVTSAGFSATRPAGEGRVSKIAFSSNPQQFGFIFWRDTVAEGYYRADADADFMIEKRDGVVSGHRIDSKVRGRDFNADNIKSFVAEGSRLFYEGPFSADSDKTITIDAVYCPK